MPIFRSTSEILNNPWIDTATDFADLDGSEAPPNHTWDYTNQLTIDESKYGNSYIFKWEILAYMRHKDLLWNFI
jgi:hypothetical protein